MAEKLDAEADAIRTEGWRRVDVRARYDYSEKSTFSSVHPDMREATKGEAAAIAALERQLEANERAWDEDGENNWERFQGESERLDAELSALHAGLCCGDAGERCLDGEKSEHSGLSIVKFE